jgi:hypothetical protein
MLENNLPQLRQLCELLRWANAQDSDEASHPNQAMIADQRNAYGHVYNAILAIITFETGPELAGRIMDLVDHGANETWFDDLQAAADEAHKEKIENERFRKERELEDELNG